MKQIQTNRFGTFEILEDRIIHFPEGLLGFPEQKDYAILDHQPGSPFFWLQSLDAPDLAFVMANPFQVKGDYLADLRPEEKEPFQGDKENGRIVFALVTVPQGRAEDATINLLGPLVIDLESRRGKQMIFASYGYSHRHPFFGES